MGLSQLKGVQEISSVISGKRVAVEVADEAAGDGVVERDPVVGVRMIVGQALTIRGVLLRLGGLWRRVFRQRDSGGAFGTLGNGVQSSGKRTARLTDRANRRRRRSGLGLAGHLRFERAGDGRGTKGTGCGHTNQRQRILSPIFSRRPEFRRPVPAGTGSSKKELAHRKRKCRKLSFKKRDRSPPGVSPRNNKVGKHLSREPASRQVKEKAEAEEWLEGSSGVLLSNRIKLLSQI
ncbi:hypothetical protein DFH08DRAFT_825015 [Mycena albidolilacea]|uniref:Uncharacterized protein n=1 Tax=Mycena albidolilacea TaxID=1033008 RepID=A0AAD6Z3G2_9AGAR|nr:hypothetical protein DFH08DRAFT_825015 [Mycena albidolilacea]